jgi:hypothetical protein
LTELKQTSDELEQKQAEYETAMESWKRVTSDLAEMKSQHEQLQVRFFPALLFFFLMFQLLFVQNELQVSEAAVLQKEAEAVKWKTQSEIWQNENKLLSRNETLLREHNEDLKVCSVVACVVLLMSFDPFLCLSQRQLKEWKSTMMAKIEALEASHAESTRAVEAIGAADDQSVNNESETASTKTESIEQQQLPSSEKQEEKPETKAAETKKE